MPSVSFLSPVLSNIFNRGVLHGCEPLPISEELTSS